VNIQTAFPDAMASYLARGGQIQQLPGFVSAPLPQRVEPSPSKPRKKSEPIPASVAREAADNTLLPRVLAFAALGIGAHAAAKKLGIGRARIERIAAKHGVTFKGARS